MTPYYVLYHGLIFCAFVLSLYCTMRRGKHYIFLSILLCLTLVIELFADYMEKRHIPFFWVYHLFVIIEYSLFCLHYLKTISTNYRWRAGLSIYLFAAFSFSVSWLVYHFKLFPGMNINLEGILLFILYTHLVFNLEVDRDIPIYMVPDFWIAVAVLLFYGGCFVCNGLFAPLTELKMGQPLDLYYIIIAPLNLVFYTFIIIGLLCSIQKSRYFMR